MVRDMTTGNSAKQILKFSLPLLIGTVFQQFYNMVDSIIVGKFLGTQPFAAVGMTGSITFFVLGLVFGACSGFAIPVAQDFGAHDEAGVRRCVANIIHIGVIFGLYPANQAEKLPPVELMQDAYDYLFWIFLGIGSLMLYNLLAGILRSLGDGTTPLIFLILSSLLNIGLDVLLVWTLNVGVKGAAIATVIAQLISGLGCLVFMIRKFPMLRLTRKDLRPDLPTIRRLSGIGFPMGLQFSITAIGSIILQKSVNALGTTIIASVSAAAKVQNLVVSPMDAFGVSMATFAGQNYGAGRIDRVRRGVRQVFWMLTAYSLLALGIVYFSGSTIALLFVDASETEILACTQHFLIMNGLFYIPLGVIYVLRNTLQGVGFSKIAMLSGLFELVARSVMGLFVVALDENGQMYPRLIHWEDGKTYEVDRILDVRPAPAARAGGQGDRYTIRMNNQETHIFFEHNSDYGSAIPGRWFVERREA